MYFFKTLKEKEFVYKQLKKGNILPFLKYLVYRARLSQFFFLKRPWYRMRIWHAPYALWLWNHPDKEKEEELFFAKYLKEGDTVVDCGAHLGTLSMVASKKVGSSGNIVSVEPHPRTFSYLEKNIKENRCHNVHLINKAIGDKEGIIAITDFYASDLNYLTEEGTTSVEMTTLDTILKDIPKIDLLKLDVEGHELQALVGGEKTLLKTNTVYFESAEGSFKRYSYTLKDIVVHLKRRGFTCFFVRDGFALEEVPENHITKTRYENILALRNLYEYSKRIG
jgi:FkbM family methyltransferase